jgi:hypothetical protein
MTCYVRVLLAGVLVGSTAALEKGMIIACLPEVLGK